jgi:hypothetical protein
MKVNAMDSALVSDESNRDQNKHHDENDALFVFREFENSEQTFHRSVAQLFLFNFGTPFSSLNFLQNCHSERSENLSHFFLDPPIQQPEMFRFAQHDKNGLFGITNRIFYFGLAKTFEPQETGIAFTAGEAFRRWTVTTVSERKIDAELDCFANDFSFRKLD